MTRDQIEGEPGSVRLTLGAHPLEVRPPLGKLVQRLAASRRGHAALAHTDNHPWLFPGGAPGLPLTSGHLMLRLQKLGIRARPARNTALFDLAAQIPAVVLSKLLGIHINTATQWTHRTGAPEATYAAEVARRGRSGNQHLRSTAR
jgi:L-alanine-DL-glutamate epimerase-like enolase superfamily enzyme